jgi:hypothetical protein
MKIDPLKLIKDFIHEYLHDNLDEIIDFRLYDLREDEKYGCPNRKFDSDDTNLMRAIYCVLFSDAWQGLTMDTLEDYTFRGDTMNTYNTMFGRPCNDSLHPGLDKFSPSKELISKVEYFQNYVCGTIGNMCVLPNIGQKYNGEYETMNTYRGCHYIWHDFFDQFLVALESVLEKKEDADYPLQKHIMLNEQAFRPYMNDDGITRLSQALLWEDYLNKDGKPFISSKGFFYWRNFDMTADDYLLEAERYVDFATRVIRHRADIMVKKLKIKLYMKHRTIDPVAIKELTCLDFHIPSYQRGYRWTTQQVSELLEDIEDFCEKGAKGIYCIQPLVVKEHGTSWDVIDGQQRLTTINIILSCLNQEKYKLQYQTRPKSQMFLSYILNRTEEEAKENIDFYHMIEARNFILRWKQGKDEEYIKEFTKILLDKVKFIWYDTDTQDPIEVFTRLNIDKIPLTSAELIKAILLNRSNFPSDDNYERIRLIQQDIASQWNEIEAMLQNDEFWLFFHDDTYTQETRIDFIFELMCSQRVLGEPTEDIGTDQSRVFRYFYGYFHDSKYSETTLKIVWEKVKKIYSTLYEWFTHLELYHYIGYLMARPKESTRQKGNPAAQQALLFKYLTEWNKPGMTIGKFKEYLIGEINNTLNDCADLGKIYELKGCPKTQCRPLLLLHNVESVIQQGLIVQKEYGQSVFTKFPFNLYKKEKWDVEHIDSNTSNELTSFNEQKEWLLTTYIISTDEQRKDIKNFCLNMQDNDNEAERKRIFDKLAQEILPEGNAEEYLDEEEKNMVWNFTLLDESTNRSYGNAIFPAKRRTIIGKEQGVYYPIPTFNKEKGFEVPVERKSKSAFIPPCTKQAFMKYYSPTSGSMVAWTKNDAEAYLKNIYRILSQKFKVKDYVSNTI